MQKSKDKTLELLILELAKSKDKNKTLESLILEPAKT